MSLAGPAISSTSWRAWSSGGRLFTVGLLPGPRARCTSGDPPFAGWWPLEGPVDSTYEDAELLTELDPTTGEVVAATVVPHIDHLATTADGAVWFTARQVLYRCPPGWAGDPVPLDLSDIL